MTMLDWMQPEAERIRVAFTKVFGPGPQPFGNQATHVGGFSDGKDGVQWNVVYDPRDSHIAVGVNLEGMAYKDWPIATLIERELHNGSLVELVRQHPEIGNVELLWRRDYWQAKSRPEIAEREIARMPLENLTEDSWRAALRVASTCLDRTKKNRGRATQTVTLPNGEQVSGPVSPHLTLMCVATDSVEYEEFFRAAKKKLLPIYEWARARTAQTVKVLILVVVAASGPELFRPANAAPRLCQTARSTSL
jgi:hypothetical protein